MQRLPIPRFSIPSSILSAASGFALGCSRGFIASCRYRICLHAKAKHALDRRDVNGEAARLHVLVNGKVTRLLGCDVNELSIKKNETFVLKLPIVYIEHVGVV